MRDASPVSLYSAFWFPHQAGNQFTFAAVNEPSQFRRKSQERWTPPERPLQNEAFARIQLWEVVRISRREAKHRNSYPDARV
jgi:hypothetical protein